MKTPIHLRLRPLTLLLAITAACGDDDTGAGGSTGTTTATQTASTSTVTSGASTGVDPFAGCKKGTLEGDFAEDLPLTGPGVDPATGKLAPGTYVVAATYLAMNPSKAERTGQLGGAVVDSLTSAQGLVAFTLGGSQSCASLRTLTVWQSEEDMLAFVVSPAHSMAMLETPMLSRGTSNTISWEGNEATASWAESTTRLGAEAGGDQ